MLQRKNKMVENTTYTISIKERFLQLLERTLDRFLAVPAFQRYVNRKANNKYGATFMTHHGNSEIDDVFSEYKFYDIQPTDIVLDIGANVGAFSLFVSRFVYHVYAVEPMLYEVLGANVINNERDNITVLTHALGKGMLEIPWEGCKTRHIIGKSLGELIQECGGHVDFIKCDCEGGEWAITAEDLRCVRRIEMEIHNFDGKHNLQNFLNLLDEARFDYEYEEPREGILIIHGRNKIW
jgi:FkbM family methyltransferase